MIQVLFCNNAASLISIPYYYICMKDKAQSRLAQFRQQIRKTHIQKIKSEFRKYSDLDFTTTSQVAASLSLPPKPEPEKYSLEEIITLTAQSLVKPPLSPNAIEEEQNPAIISIEGHIRFWKLYSQQLHIAPQTKTQSAATILLLIIKHHKYESVHYNTMYELHILNTLELVCPKMSRSDRGKVLDWIAGAEGLRVIDACLSEGSENHFLNYSNYTRVYKVLELGLRSELKAQSVQAAKILTKILKDADWDDTFSLYENAQGLMTYVCMKVERYCAKQETEVFNIAIMFLLDCYDEAILNYARAGTAYVACMLIDSSIDSNRNEGLEILRILSQIEGRKMVTFLLENRDLARIRIWEQLLTTDHFSRSKNIKIRKNFFSVLENLLCSGEKEDVELLCSRFGGRYQDIFTMLAESLENEDEVFILLRVVGCISSLLYLGKQIQATHMIVQALQEKGIIRPLQSLERFQIEELSLKVGEIMRLLQCGRQAQQTI